MNLDHLKELPPEVIFERLVRLTTYIENFERAMLETVGKESNPPTFSPGLHTLGMVRKEMERILN